MSKANVKRANASGRTRSPMRRGSSSIRPAARWAGI